MHAFTACYVLMFQLRHLDVGSAAAVALFQLFLPSPTMSASGGSEVYFAHVSSLATCLSWCSVKLALRHVSPRSAVYRRTSEKHLPYHGTTASVLVQQFQRQRASSVTPKRVLAAEQHVYTTQSFQQTQPLSPDDLRAIHGCPVSTRARNAVPQLSWSIQTNGLCRGRWFLVVVISK